MTLVGRKANLVYLDVDRAPRYDTLKTALIEAGGVPATVTVRAFDVEPEPVRAVTIRVGARGVWFERELWRSDADMTADGRFAASVEVWQAMRQLSDRGAGRVLGVSASTIRRWRKGLTCPRDPSVWNDRMWSWLDGPQSVGDADKGY